LLSCLIFTYDLSVGASGAIFGLVGLEIIYFFSSFNNVEKKRLVVFILVIPITMLSLLNPEPGVDFAGHIGGVMVGLTLGLAFAAEDSSLRIKKMLALFFYGLTATIIITCLVILYTMEMEDQSMCTYNVESSIWFILNFRANKIFIQKINKELFNTKLIKKME